MWRWTCPSTTRRCPRSCTIRIRIPRSWSCTRPCSATKTASGWILIPSPRTLREATIAIEDKRFESHHGVDWHGTVRAVFRTLTKGNTQGGSTITQQLIKNVTGNNENTVKRKVTEGVPGSGPERTIPRTRFWRCT
ncbi:MAG: transglycosylase domain-containing protein [Oscillospiraceae bacterium]